MNMNSNPYKSVLLAIGLPTFEDVKAEFALSLAKMTAVLGHHGVEMVFCHSKATWVAHARNMIVTSALEFGATHLLFIDSDISHPNYIFHRLHSWDKDIVCASYVKKKFPHETVGNAMPAHGDVPLTEKLVPTTGLHEFLGIPLGCALIKTEVFRRMKPPYFRYKIDEVKGTLGGEDLLWCEDVRALGYKIWVDLALTMEIGHVGSHTYRPEAAYAMFDPETGLKKTDKAANDVWKKKVQGNMIPGVEYERRETV